MLTTSPLPLDIERERQVSQVRRDEAAADAAAKRAERRARATVKANVRAERQARQQERRRATAARIAAAGRWARPVAPLLVVTGFAMYGQIAYGVEAYSPPGWPLPWRLLVAVGAAVGVESIALYVCWHAHDALLMGATATAARMRRASYFIALTVAGVNYAHFADGWSPTPAAVVFAIFSAAGPWLWGLHTRRAQHLQLLREGQADSSGAAFSAERWRAFPIRTWAARRWSIDHGVTDPRQAWAGYNTHRADARSANVAEKAAKDAERAAEKTARNPAKAGAPAHAALALNAGIVGEPAPWRPRLVADQVADRQTATLARKPATDRGRSVHATPTPPDQAGATPTDATLAKVRELVAANAGRNTVAKTLGVKPHVARNLINKARQA